MPLIFKTNTCVISLVLGWLSCVPADLEASRLYVSLAVATNSQRTGDGWGGRRFMFAAFIWSPMLRRSWDEILLWDISRCHCGLSGLFHIGLGQRLINRAINIHLLRRRDHRRWRFRGNTSDLKHMFYETHFILPKRFEKRSNNAIATLDGVS